MRKPYKVVMSMHRLAGVLKYDECAITAYGGMIGVGKRLKEDANLANGAYHNGFAAACRLLGEAGQLLYDDFLNSEE